MINKYHLLGMQVPDFASVVHCALGKGGGKGNRDDVYGIFHILIIVTNNCNQNNRILIVDILKSCHKYKCNSVNTNSCIDLKCPL